MVMSYRKLILLIAFILAACTPISSRDVENQPLVSPNANMSTQMPGSPMMITPDQPMGAMTITTGTAEAGAYTEFQQGNLSIQLYSPQDEEVFNVSQIEVSGKAPVETVISINDQIVVVSETGDFSVPVSLEEGPNIIELIASDLDGNELDIVLTVVYEP
ncbi:MAG: hypothetical protein A2X25_01020 [Chloroflexi bacterium GWB2_49_20]|nr:MAG: hypothetical protein A2X25_01020 [Chloroflexi bacterium GWB2_49_20]OGN78701.1 MAG: hypothetical protein A2X26_07860 [Chloroflexi bacterium GWC2_49_37]OGN85342.1 MAG: hypothetical protein A2X27_03390 [Chloroflexi bacterium GWD2_49_16]HBG73832.1 hypothetical protein [Anaerolineae bacterium]HCC79422.1 hypothetical protein [Anaerolineae bacterium]